MPVGEPRPMLSSVESFLPSLFTTDWKWWLGTLVLSEMVPILIGTGLRF
jgi:hypothetical protein